MRRMPWSRLRALAVLAAAAGGAALVYLVDPAASRLFPPCPFLALTGLLCPGCGTTRAAHQLLHGHPVAALELNPLLPLYLPFLGHVLLSELRVAAGREPLSFPLLPRSWIQALLGLILAFWVTRNLSPG